MNLCYSMCEFHGFIVFPSSKAAEIAMNALVPSANLDSIFQKSVQDKTLKLLVRNSTPRDLQRALNGVLEQLHLIVRTLEVFDMTY